MELDFVEPLFRFSFPALTERKGDRALWSAQLEHAAKGHTQRPLSGQRTGERCFCKKEVWQKVFFSFLFSLYLLGSFRTGLGCVGLPAPRGLRGPQFPSGGGGAPATGLSP